MHCYLRHDDLLFPPRFFRRPRLVSPSMDDRSILQVSPFLRPTTVPPLSPILPPSHRLCRSYAHDVFLSSLGWDDLQTDPTVSFKLLCHDSTASTGRLHT